MTAGVVGVIANKGGVGKTTTSFELACESAHRGLRVLAIDADRQADLTRLCGYSRSETLRGLDAILWDPPASLDARPYLSSVRPGFDLIRSSEALEEAANRIQSFGDAASLLLERALAPLMPEYDLMVIDLGHRSKLTRTVAVVAHLIVMPCVPAPLDAEHAGDVLAQAGEFRRELGLPRGDVLNRSFISLWHRTRIGASEGRFDELLRERYPNQVYPAAIPNSVRVAEAQAQRMSLREYRNAVGHRRDKSLNAMIDAYSELTDFALERLAQGAVA